MLIGDLGGHAGEIARLLLLPDPCGGPLEAGLIQDERIVRRAAVETEAGPGQGTLGLPLGVGIAHDGDGRNDEIDIAGRATGGGRARGHLRDDAASEITRLAEGVDVHTVGNLAGHPQHPRIHRCDIDFGVGFGDRTGAPLGGDVVQVVELAVVVEVAGPERRETSSHRQNVVAQPGAGMVEGAAVAAHHMGANLGAQAEPEAPAAGLLQLPGGGRGDERTAGKGNRDAGGQLQTGGGLGGHRGVEIGGAAGFGEQQTGETRGLSAGGDRADGVQRLRNRHHVDLHGFKTTSAPMDGRVGRTWLTQRRG